MVIFHVQKKPCFQVKFVFGPSVRTEDVSTSTRAYSLNGISKNSIYLIALLPTLYWTYSQWNESWNFLDIILGGEGKVL